jgi:hypothetical protein
MGKEETKYKLEEGFFEDSIKCGKREEDWVENLIKTSLNDFSQRLILTI